MGALAVPPAIWAVHFILSYATAAIVCAKIHELDAARIAIAVYSLVALALLALTARRARRDDFLGKVTLAVAALSAVAVVYEALAAVFIGSCR